MDLALAIPVCPGSTMPAVHRPLVALTTLAWFVACTGPAGTADTEPGATLGPDGQPVVVDANPQGAGVVVRAVGPDLVGPTRLIVHTRADLFAPEAIGNPPPDGTMLAFTPEVEGTFTVTDRDTLTFVPANGFRPGTKYTAKLASLSVGDKTYDPSTGGTWDTEFTTPAFTYARVGLQSHDIDDGVVDLLVMYTAAVDPTDVGKHATFTWRGHALKPTAVAAGAEPYQVRFTFKDRALRQEGRMDVALSAGVAFVGDAAVQAPAATAGVDVKAGAPVDILATKVREGANGFYVDVICNDHAVSTTRYYWDRVDYDDYEVSTRCLLSEDEVARAVHLEPAAGEVSVASAPGGFRLFAPVSKGSYHLTIDAGAATVDSGVLKTSYEADLEVPARSAMVAFTAKGRYLPRSAWKNLAIEHRNVEAVDVEIRHVPEQNLVFWLDGSEAASSATSDLVATKTISLHGKADEDAETWLDVSSMVQDPERGVYEVTLRAKVPVDAAPAEEEQTHDTGYQPHAYGDVSEDGKWRYVARTSSRILLTDIHLIAKLSSPEGDQPYTPRVQVWTLDVQTNRPVGGADVRLVRPSGFTLAECRTDVAGGCAMDVPQDGTDKQPPFALIADKGDDLTYIRFADLKVDTTSDVSGEPYILDRAYDAAVYPDRGVYRPGETAHLSAIVRDNAHQAPQAGLPVVVKLFDPMGKLLKKKVLATNSAGMLSTDLPFADFARTGRYRASMEVADIQVGQASFNVEEFVPERMHVDVKPGIEAALAADPVPMDVNAVWLFGGSAAGSKVEVKCQVQPSTFHVASQPDWAFGLAGLEDRRVRPVDVGTVTGVIGDDGHAAISCPSAAKGGGLDGAAEMVAQVAVFEGESGRSTSAQATIPVHPETYYVGLNAANHKVVRGGTTHVEGELVDWKGKAAKGAPARVTIEVQRLEREYGWVWDDEENSSVYRQMHRRSRESTQTVEVGADGRFAVDFAATDESSEYLIVAKVGGARTELLLDPAMWYWDWWGDSEDTTPRPQRPTDLPITVADTIGVGDDVAVKITAPYAGRMLVAVETDRLVDWQWKDVDQAGPVDWSFRLKDFAPNVYVTAFLVKDPHAESNEAFLPDRAFGAVSVRVQPKEYTYALTVKAPAEIRPNSHFDVALDVGGAPEGDTFATVAVVDEGILSLTKFADPDPFAQIFRKRALGIESYETVGWTLAIPPGGPSSHTGGDEIGGGGRVQMVKPVALWSGIVPIGADGKANVGFDVPGYRGQLRVMAVTSGTAKMGAASAKITVRDPLTLQTTLPRFLVGDDSAQIPVALTNVSGKDRDVTVTIAATDMGVGDRGMVVASDSRTPVLSFTDGQSKAVHLAKDQTATVVFTVAATRAPGAVTVRVTAKADDLTSYEELEIPIEPSQPEARLSSRIVVAEGSTDVAPTLDGWLDGSETTTFWVTTNPYAPAMSHLGYLVHYPYGCIEQTVSSARPLLYVGDLLATVDPESIKDQPIDGMIAAGIDRALSMQTASGGFAYWPGGTTPNFWGSVYATHFLLDAKKAGHPVPQTAIDNALNWLDREVAHPPTDGDLRTQAYAQYVLAVAGKGHAAAARDLVEKLPTSDAEGIYLAKAAVYLAGDRRFEQDLRHPDATPLTWKRENSWTFWSDLRSRGLILSTYFDLFGRDKAANGAGQALADVVGQGLAQHPSYWYTTQELVWGVTGLGKWVQDDGSAIKSAELTADGAAATKIGDPKASATRNTWKIARATLAQSLALELDKGTDVPVYLLETTEGVRKVDDLAYGGQGLQITRSLVEPSGRAASPGGLTLGEALAVKITIKNTSHDRVENIALVDRLPAGFEIENTRLGQGLMPAWVDESTLWEPDSMNLRDDRVEVFGGLDAGDEKTIVYLVRATTAGSFTQPEIRAEAMYDPTVWARTRGDSVRIAGPWN
jgi:uncharacterized protein YfaS (alpha-2-macroglobulin family)